jgi:hypothetical protein
MQKLHVILEIHGQFQDSGISRISCDRSEDGTQKDVLKTNPHKPQNEHLNHERRRRPYVLAMVTLLLLRLDSTRLHFHEAVFWRERWRRILDLFGGPAFGAKKRTSYDLDNTISWPLRRNDQHHLRYGGGCAVCNKAILRRPVQDQLLISVFDSLLYLPDPNYHFVGFGLRG